MAELKGSNDLLQKAHSLCADGHTLDALKLCLLNAEAGDIACARLVGWIYCKGGASVEKNPREAKRWLTLASDNGDPLATYLLGTFLFEDGKTETAIEKFHRAGEQGVSSGLYQLGKMYEVGYGVEKDKERAYNYYRQSASMGPAFARRRVAGMLIGGHRGVIGRLVGIPMLVVSIVLGIYTAVTDPYGERIYY
ncbi:MAG: hypothetical protein BMS9Abin01_0749 [Gammaproteobacteria bacterium]|nr:MAG: hypothetical protein BMS9Abin01_0749 [Gammaproteobacteria bacterium]